MKMTLWHGAYVGGAAACVGGAGWAEPRHGALDEPGAGALALPTPRNRSWDPGKLMFTTVNPINIANIFWGPTNGFCGS